MNESERTELFLGVLNARKGIVYKIANSYCRNSRYRNDLVQEIILQLWKAFPTYDSQFEPGTWMYRIALNVAISFYRKDKKVTGTQLNDELLQFVADDQPDENEANVQLLYKFIGELDELNKALMLLYLDDKSQKQMAEILGISETNVATKIGRIKEKLREKFKLANQ